MAEFEVQLGPGMTFAITEYPHLLTLCSIPVERYHELAREFTQLFLFSKEDAFISWTKTEAEVSLIVDEVSLLTTPELKRTVADDFGQRWRAMQVHC